MVAPAGYAVFIQGETGTGKGLVARATHDQSAWKGHYQWGTEPASRGSLRPNRSGASCNGPGGAGTRHDLERLIGKAFLTAHLLTGCAEQAESAALEAIDSWHPDDETEEALFKNVLRAAAQAHIQRSPKQSNNPGAGASCLPEELQAVLRLAPEVRRCYVLRILVGLTRQACARLLALQPGEVDDYTCAALKSLAGLRIFRGADAA